MTQFSPMITIPIQPAIPISSKVFVLTKDGSVPVLCECIKTRDNSSYFKFPNGEQRTFLKVFQCYYNPSEREINKARLVYPYFSYETTKVMHTESDCHILII